MNHGKALLAVAILLVSGYAATYLVLHRHASDMVDIQTWKPFDTYYDNEQFEYGIYIEILNTAPVMFQISANFDLMHILADSSMKYIGNFELVEQRTHQTGYLTRWRFTPKEILTKEELYIAYEVVSKFETVSFNDFAEDRFNRLVMGDLTRGTRLKGVMTVKTSIWIIPFEYSLFIDVEPE